MSGEGQVGRAAGRIAPSVGWPAQNIGMVFPRRAPGASLN
ncbi:unnamed protein product [Ciceribacter selenitireducens ATCC BAA-1503]|uniref:Uncharacterized protein n=1 Tax=Ciceribacter selenitireducens ATCC BAA-1503 TaxID=1336235 RepID=A0A376AAN8_9HYPH|nr:unnamed protein product [Ciceribacter selenitireducens ATCC BAA-1503]